MGKLDEAIIYTSGAMEFAADHGVEWRRKFIHQVWDAGLTTIDIIDPTDKPGPPEFKVGEEKDFQTALQQVGRYEELRQYVGQYRRYDLRCCDYMDALVACIDPTIPHWGTPNEIYVAETAHKPRFCIIDGGLSRLPRWLFDVFPLENVFSTIEDCVQHLVDLDSGKIPLSREWVLIRKHLRQYRERCQNI